MAVPKTALVTGAGSGMGRLAARRLADAGATVAALDIDADALGAVCASTPKLRPYVCDVADWSAVDHAVGTVREDLGAPDRLVHAAGIPSAGALASQGLGDIRRVIDVNLMGTVHLVQAVVPDMIRRGSGELVLFGSIGGWIPSAYAGAYSASKAGVHAIAEALTGECQGLGIRVVCVCPPLVETPMAEWARHTHPELLGQARGIAPSDVLDAVERTLAVRGLYVFPGRGTTALWRARRLAPGLLRGLIERKLRGGITLGPALPHTPATGAEEP
ncbi:SDR family NAD(P)-dependent oxidoreductase [Streptomyces formicae]|uniref:SDR family oxidoreductase n=1 Tax=Streptomyces formicae TaxID=1616117 RepID=A0ABY3WK09_9ACTN|nr:SDR family oxidoreductase [Streptomyces formicae]UNM11814.1 SDR family oxidoreductase [Streptomyces formicae]